MKKQTKVVAGSKKAATKLSKAEQREVANLRDLNSHGQIDGKMAAANDKPEVANNGKVKAKVPVPDAVEIVAHALTVPGPKKAAETKAPKAIKSENITYVIGNTESIKRGFVKLFVDFVVAKKSATTEQLINEFVGRQIEGRKITKERVLRYCRWCVNNEVFKAK